MNKFIRRQMKIAKLKRREAMIYGEITPAKKNVINNKLKYDIYEDENQDSFLCSFNCKEAVIDYIHKRVKEELPDISKYNTCASSDYKLERIKILHENAWIYDKEYYCDDATGVKVYAEYWYECLTATTAYHRVITKTLFYYVDDRIEM